MANLFIFLIIILADLHRYSFCQFEKYFFMIYAEAISLSFIVCSISVSTFLSSDIIFIMFSKIRLCGTFLFTFNNI